MFYSNSGVQHVSFTPNTLQPKDCTLHSDYFYLLFRDRRCRWARSVVVPCTAVRVRGLVAGGCGFVNGCRAAAAARRGRRERLQLAVDLWRNGATFHKHQYLLAGSIVACAMLQHCATNPQQVADAHDVHDEQLQQRDSR